MLKEEKYFNKNLFIFGRPTASIFRKFVSLFQSFKFIKEKVKVSVAIINANNIKETRGCIRSILSTQKIPVLILVLNNGSKEPITQLKEDIKKEGKCIETKKIGLGFLRINFELWQLSNIFLILADSDKNIGFCGGNNFLVSLSYLIGLDYCLILNNDARLTKNILAEMLEIIKKEKVFALSPQIFDKEGKTWYAGGNFSWYSYKYLKKPRSSFLYLTKVHSGCAFLVNVKDYIKLGGMEEALFFSLDEPYLARKILKNKGKIMVAPQLSVIHRIGGTGGRAGSKIHDYFWTRNRLIYSLRYNFVLIHWFFIFIYSLMKIVKWSFWLMSGYKSRAKNEISAFRDFFKRNWWAGYLREELNALDFKKVIYGK